VKGSARAVIVALSFVVSSVLIHVAVMGNTPWLEWLALASLVFVPFSLPLIALRWRAWLAFVPLCAGLWPLVQYGGGRPLLYLPSILIPAALAWFFGRTLVAGRQALITTVALAARPATPDYLVAYSRRLTEMWTGIFIAMTIWDFALAVCAPRAAWSFMANGANYLVIGATVTFEYLFRRWRFRDYDHPGFVEYVRIVVSADPRRMRGP
jgi:uncharacterized membrane protein